MNKLSIAAALGGPAALLLSGCSSGPSPSRTPPPRSVPRQISRAPAIAPVSDAAYVASAGAMDLFEVRSGELALQRSASVRVKEFASMMVAAHKGTAAQLSLAGRRLNLLPSAVLPPRY